jgi:phospholipid-binding lipoprotein MlaA
MLLLSVERICCLLRRLRPALAPLLGLFAFTITLSGCATLPGGKPARGDPFERFNRSVYAFNTVFDHKILRPVARGYAKITPLVVRARITNFITNLQYPTTLINDFLQGRPNDGGQDLARLVVNTTIGIGGLFDPASRMGIDRHEQDFGQTLGRWGFHTGPYLMLPFLGPSTVRDAIGLGPDYYALYEIVSVGVFNDNNYVNYGLFTVKLVNRRADLLDSDAILEKTFDPYAFVRDAYVQEREYQIHDGENMPAEQFQDPGADSDAGPGPDSSRGAAPSATPGAAPAATPQGTSPSDSGGAAAPPR